MLSKKKNDMRQIYEKIKLFTRKYFLTLESRSCEHTPVPSTRTRLECIITIVAIIIIINIGEIK